MTTRELEKSTVYLRIFGVILVLTGVLFSFGSYFSFTFSDVFTDKAKSILASSFSPKEIPERIFFIKTFAPQIKSELYSVLTDGSDLRFYSKPKSDVLVRNPEFNAKTKSFLISALMNGVPKVVIHEWDTKELFGAKSSVMIDALDASFFPDGSKILFTELDKKSKNFNICSIDSKGKDKKILKSFKKESSEISQLRVSPDGKFAIYQLKSQYDKVSYLYKMDLNDIKATDELVVKIHTIGNHNHFAISPSGNQMAVIDYDNFVNVLKIFDFKSKKNEIIYKSKSDLSIASWSSNGKHLYVVESCGTDLSGNVFINKIDIEDKKHAVTILRNEKGVNIGSY